MEQYTIILKKYKQAAIVLLFTVIILVGLWPMVNTSFSEFKSLKSDYETQSQAETELRETVARLKQEFQDKSKQESSLPKALFRPITAGLDTEASISDEFAEILQLLRENKIKTHKVSYTYDPEDDNFVQNAKDKYHVARISTELVASYSQFENFLKDLYKHEHFLNIENIKIKPYQKNKKILVINLDIKLYAQRNGESMPNDSAEAASNNQSEPPSIEKK